MLFSMRVSMMDEPGALGALTSALGRVEANIVTLDVIQRDDGVAVDDLVLETPDDVVLADFLRRTAEEAPGAVVEAIRPIRRVEVGSSPMHLAASVAETDPERAPTVLMEGLPQAMWASWAVALRPGSPPEVIASSSGAPSMSNVDTPWLPLDKPRRLPSAPWMPPAWCMGRMSYEMAAAPLSSYGGAVLLARKHGPRFRPTELEQLGLLIRVYEGVTNASFTST